ncbi:Gfo/Idh/MocA family oxidoreductase [Leptospira sp. 201903075]|uniref:Gfo/Idh/MocA family protein n=1 Tax=Leptospira chreensis TaxID=2810035 RepID=UPI001963D004|nr:Gfo/Idh/MocA family oxidoreductase [Leptospira chreensis]MBM9589067.1 Gfo/Idh/MocA family oxidoreductase [Leptospira chreensis]
MFKALLFGCGNIGARYDLNLDSVLSHAKAYSLDSDFLVDAYDTNPNYLDEVGRKYGFGLISDFKNIRFSDYDMVSICSPTETHVNLLELCFQEKVKLILCEKPISYDKEKINFILGLYAKGDSRVIVNYIRRFQHGFLKLKEILAEILKVDTLVGIDIRYCRGFLNNCSHALDLIEFIFGSELSLDDIKISEKNYDSFSEDPTISLLAKWNGYTVSVSGKTNIHYPVFEIDFYFGNHRIRIQNSGNDIEVLSSLLLNERLEIFSGKNSITITHCLENYMLPVFHKAKQFLLKETDADNFVNSSLLNLKMLGYLNG